MSEEESSELYSRGYGYVACGDRAVNKTDGAGGVVGPTALCWRENLCDVHQEQGPSRVRRKTTVPSNRISRLHIHVAPGDHSVLTDTSATTASPAPSTPSALSASSTSPASAAHLSATFSAPQRVRRRSERCSGGVCCRRRHLGTVSYVRRICGAVAQWQQTLSGSDHWQVQCNFHVAETAEQPRQVLP